MHEVREETRDTSVPGEPVPQREQHEDARGAVIGMAVERIGKRDGGRPGLAQHALELPAEIVTIVRNAAVERLGIGRAHGSGGRRALGHVAPPVSLKELLEAAIGEAEEAQAHPVAPELPHRCPRLAQPPLAVGDVHGRARSELPGLVPHRLHVAVSRGDQHDAHGGVRRHHPLDQTTRAERLVVRVGCDHEQPLPALHGNGRRLRALAADRQGRDEDHCQPQRRA